MDFKSALKLELGHIKTGTTGIFMGTNQVAPDETRSPGGSQTNF